QAHWPLSRGYGLAGKTFDRLFLCTNPACHRNPPGLGRCRSCIGFHDTDSVSVLVESNCVLPARICRHNVHTSVQSALPNWDYLGGPLSLLIHNRIAWMPGDANL